MSGRTPTRDCLTPAEITQAQTHERGLLLRGMGKEFRELFMRILSSKLRKSLPNLTRK